VRFNRRAKAKSGAERCERERRREYFGVRRRREITIGVFFVEDFAAVGVGDQQAPRAAGSSARGELHLDARGESLNVGPHARRCRGRALRGVRARRSILRAGGQHAERARRGGQQRASQARPKIGRQHRFSRTHQSVQAQHPDRAIICQRRGGARHARRERAARAATALRCIALCEDLS